MNNYYYSAMLNAFFPTELEAIYKTAETWPSDAVHVSEAIFNEFSSTAPDGKMRGTSSDSLPCWVDIPPPTADELISNAETEKKRLLVIVNAIITPLIDAVELEMATPEEVTALKAWKTYRVLLNRIDTSTAPNIDWPKQP